MRRLTPTIDVRLADSDAEQVRRNTATQISEIQKLPAIALRTIQNVSLANGVATPVAHGLGRRPELVIPSVPRGAVAAGRIDEIRDGSYSLEKHVVLKATGYGATITIDLGVL